jgi:hypothetical protein
MGVSSNLKQNALLSATAVDDAQARNAAAL